jgi:hypothetical protein
MGFIDTEDIILMRDYVVDYIYRRKQIHVKLFITNLDVENLCIAYKYALKWDSENNK